MKTIIVTCLAFACSSGHAQATFHHAAHTGSDRTFNGVSVGSKSYYLTGTRPMQGCCFETVQLVAADPTGKEISRIPLFQYAWLEGCGITKTPDENLLVYGGTTMKGCDQGGSEFLIMKVDTSGVSQWSVTVPFIAEAVSASTGNEFYLLGNGKIVRYSASSVIDTVQLYSAVPHGVVRLSTGNTAISYFHNGSPHLRIITGTGAILHDKVTPVTLTRLKETTTGFLAGLASGDVYHFNDTLKLLGQSSSLPSGWFVNDFAYHNSSFLLGVSPNGQPGYAIADGSLLVTHTVVSNITRAQVSGVTINDAGRALLLSTCATDAIPGHSITSLFSFVPPATLPANHDIGVVAVSVGAGQPVSVTAGPVCAISVLATIRNFGTDTVKNFRLQHYTEISGTSHCLIGLNQRFNSLIAPGGTVAVQTGTFYTSYTQSAPGPATVNPCIYTTVPGEENDIMLSNDMACSSATVVLSIFGDEEGLDGSIAVYPNPSSDGFRIVNPGKLEFVELSDLSGKVVESVSVFNSTGTTVGRGLRPGLYLLEIQCDGLRYHRKVLVEQ